MKLLNDAIAIDNNFADTYDSRGVVYLDLGEVELAYEDFKRAISIDPSNAKFYFDLGQLFFSYLPNSDSAIFYYTKAIEIGPQSLFNDMVYMNMGVVNSGLGNSYEALSNYKSAENISPNNDLILYNLALSLLDVGNYQEALEKVKKAIRVNPNDEGYFNLEGSIYLDINSLKEAEEAFLEAIKINSNYGVAYYNLGYLYGEQKHHILSIDNYSKAIELEFDLKATLVNCGLEKIEINDIKSACIDFNKAYELGRVDIAPLINANCN